MKSVLIAIALTGLALNATAMDKIDLENEIQKLTAKFEAMQAKPDRRVPPERLRLAAGVLLLDRTKAGFLFAFQGGHGVALLKTKSGKWTAPAFFSTGEASFGFQAGGQQTFMVVLLVNTNAAKALAHGDVTFGGEASGTAGDAGGKADGELSQTDAITKVYYDTSGLYGGVSLKTGALNPDMDAHEVYYGRRLGVNEILFGQKAKPEGAALALGKKLNEAMAKK